MNDKYSWEDHLDKIIKERKEGEAEITRLPHHLKMYEAECSGLREAGFENAQDLFTSYEGLRQQRDMLMNQLNVVVNRIVLIATTNESEYALEYCRRLARKTLADIAAIQSEVTK